MIDYRLVLVTYLHDVGKVLLRNGESPKCQIEGYAHDRLTCDFLQDYLGNEYVDIFKSGKWKRGDFASATERTESEEGKNPSLTPLLGPICDEESCNTWYSVLPISMKAAPETYFAKNFEETRTQINYKGIAEKLRNLAKKASMIKDPECLLETYDYIYKSSTLFVPAAVYKAIPNTSLYGHSRLAAALVSCEKLRLLLIDIKGLQKFITNVKGEAQSSKRFRGRSLFLQLIQMALVDVLAMNMGIPSLNNISFEPGKILFITCGKLDVVEKILEEISKWSDYEIQFAYSVSGEISVNDIKFRDKSGVFAKELESLFYNLKLVGRPQILENVKVDNFYQISTKVLDVNLEKLATEEKRVSLMNLISLIVGHYSREIKYLVEVIYKNNEKGNNTYYDGYGEIYVEPLNVGFFFVQREEKLKEIVNYSRGKAKRIKILKVNDPDDFIEEDLIGENTCFGYITLSVYHPLINGKFPSLDDLADYIALGVVDGDKIGEIVRKLSYYPTRFMTFATLLDFAYTHVVTRFVEDNRKGEDYPVIVLYSGGDDLAVYGKWDKVLDLLIQLSGKIQNIIPQISVSGGLFVFKKKYPIYYAYFNTRELEGIAKEERENKGGRLASNIFEKYPANNGTLISLGWEEVKKFLDQAKLLAKDEKVSNSYLYKIYEIGEMMESGEIARALVTYAYLNARDKDQFERVSKICQIPPYPGNNVVEFIQKFRDVINMYSLLKREK